MKNSGGVSGNAAAVAGKRLTRCGRPAVRWAANRRFSIAGKPAAIH